MDPEQATSFKQLFMSMLPNNGGIVVGTVTNESPLTIKMTLSLSSTRTTATCISRPTPFMGLQR